MYTVRVAFEVMVFICIGVCFPKQSLNCNTIASHSPNEWDVNGFHPMRSYQNKRKANNHERASHVRKSVCDKFAHMV